MRIKSEHSNSRWSRGDLNSKASIWPLLKFRMASVEFESFNLKPSAFVVANSGCCKELLRTPSNSVELFGGLFALVWLNLVLVKPTSQTDQFPSLF